MLGKWGFENTPPGKSFKKEYKKSGIAAKYLLNSHFFVTFARRVGGQSTLSVVRAARPTGAP
jgi:hypothetical protein